MHLLIKQGKDRHKQLNDQPQSKVMPKSVVTLCTFVLIRNKTFIKKLAKFTQVL